MLRLILGAVAGAVAWLVVAFAVGLMLGMLWPELAAASRNPLTLTTPMLMTRLGCSFLGSIIGGAVAARIGRNSSMASLGSGLLLLMIFVPYHLTIWNNFPIWYHLTFFVSLPVLSWFGSRFALLPTSTSAG